VSIEVEGARYKVLDSLGWQASAGVFAKEVETPDGPRVAVRSRRGLWRWWTARERVQPLVDGLRREPRP
jgi:hypothetical protein